jgi:hypothetical protein
MLALVVVPVEALLVEAVLEDFQALLVVLPVEALLVAEVAQ